MTGPADGAGVLTTFSIYRRESECSGPYYVVVPWEITSTGQTALEPLGAASTVMEAREFIPPWADQCFPRTADDEPDVVETWL